MQSIQMLTAKILIMHFKIHYLSNWKQIQQKGIIFPKICQKCDRLRICCSIGNTTHSNSQTCSVSLCIARPQTHTSILIVNCSPMNKECLITVYFVCSSKSGLSSLSTDAATLLPIRPFVPSSSLLSFNPNRLNHICQTQLPIFSLWKGFSTLIA